MVRLFSQCRMATVVLLLWLVSLAACGAPPGNPADGRRWYRMNNCTACHGQQGNDGKAPNIANLKMSFSSFLNKLRTTDAPIMPPFPETKVSRQDAADIYAFLHRQPPGSGNKQDQQ